MFSFRILNFKSEGGSTANKRLIESRSRETGISELIIYCEKAFDYFQQPQRQTLQDWSWVVYCWERQTEPTVKVTKHDIREWRKPFRFKWPFLELHNLESHGLQLKQRRTKHISRPITNKMSSTNHPIHAECNQYKACPFTGTLISRQCFHSQNIDYTMESSFCDVKDVQMALSGVEKTTYMLYIRFVYIHIFQEGLSTNKFYWRHVSIANLKKRIHNLSWQTFV